MSTTVDQKGTSVYEMSQLADVSPSIIEGCKTFTQRFESAPRLQQLNVNPKQHKQLEVLPKFPKVGETAPIVGLIAREGERKVDELAVKSRRGAFFYLKTIGYGSGYVYVVEAESMGLVKIGFSRKHPIERLRCLQISSPARLVAQVILWGTLEIERYLHWRFRDARSHGEWFRATRVVRQFIERARCIQNQQLRIDKYRHDSSVAALCKEFSWLQGKEPTNAG